MAGKNTSALTHVSSAMVPALSCTEGRVFKPGRSPVTPVAMLLLSALMMYPILSPGAEEAVEQNPTGVTGESSVVPEQILMDKMEQIKEVGSMRIVLHALASSQSLADDVQSLLAALGADEVQTRIVDDVPDSNQVRYFHAEDEQAGRVVGEALSLVFDEVAVRNFESYKPAPSVGLVEIWLR